MIKHFCDKCGKELKRGRKKLQYKPSIIFLKKSVELEFCEECFENIIKSNKELLEEFKEK